MISTYLSIQLHGLVLPRHGVRHHIHAGGRGQQVPHSTAQRACVGQTLFAIGTGFCVSVSGLGTVLRPGAKVSMNE